MRLLCSWWESTEEDKEKSNFWKRVNGKFDYSHH